ncbi:3'(2'),5'-bisphosphate nucleotidase CysQ [Shewanella psychrotolerans]|uniref:3'(2'),5'-bisphosphate nucleotidase CysQ n=1 Tax=Shewanella psychrotolerans TaxID=2864206 RepID=UPI001C656C88|nr:3'(2'),5'-bisphosphate nucleotidase CysQ [Shewanella psychrotolerans]QYK00258.1 3'(2'),5'-bisphosphate nucleotidase CysQ [Shewanella psychrotolerans]
MSLNHTFKQEWLAEIVEIAKEAGDVIMHVYESADFGIEAKSDDSPVTAADIASHEAIVAKLAQLTPDIPVMSEEAADIAWDERRHWQQYWLIDPLDGTKEFIKRNGEFTVNIAFIDNGRAVAGVVYAPVLDKCYYGALDIGAWLATAHQVYDLNTQAVSVPIEPRVVGSRSHVSPGLEKYLVELGAHSMTSIGSSLKFCLLAEGEAEIYPRLGLTSEWDTAAAQAVLESAGGLVINYETGLPLDYNQKENILNPYFIATAKHWPSKQ